MAILHAHPLAEAGHERHLLGQSRHAGTGHARRPGEVWLVLHRDWTGILRVDPRDGRTVHLERALDGDRRAEAVRWAVETFALAEPARTGARILAAANGDEARASEAKTRRVRA